MRSALLTLALATLMSACGESSSPTGPSTSAVASLATVDTNDPLDDAIARIAPVFGDSEFAQGLSVALLRVKNGEATALALAEASLGRLEREDPALVADVDAIRLALRASR